MKLSAAYIDQKLFFTFVVLMGIGLVMVFSASSVGSLEKYHDKFHFLKLQFAWAAIGSVFFLFFLVTDYRLLRPYATAGLLLTVLLLGLVHVPGLGRTVGGATRWVHFGGFQIQPAELAKFAVALFLADRLARNYRKRDSFRDYLLANLAILGMICAMIIKQPNLSSAVIVGCIGFLLIATAYSNLRHIALMVLLGIAGVVLLIYMAPYRMRRLEAFMDPFNSPYGSGYHLIQSLIAMGSGGLMGVGIGQSHQKFLYLPEEHTDFIFSIIGEELGFVGGAIILVLYSVLFWRGLRTALNAPDLFGMLLALGLIGGIAMQELLNVAVVIGLAPTTGVTLPFISYGGSSLIFSMASIAVILNISLAGERERLNRSSGKWSRQPGEELEA
ncbi:MAG: putative lipid II flippase FtsW [Candidatus Riflebacteria bacterium]|nr:putative lipid II flippase FtsW [Candidatus Riflebacteria bacterium]